MFFFNKHILDYMKKFVAMAALLPALFIYFPVAGAEADILDVLARKGILNAKELEELRQSDKKETDLGMYWDKGLRFGTRDKAFKFKLGGRIFSDWAFAKGENRGLRAVHGRLDESTEFRAARLYLAGLMYGNVIFKAQYDFAGGASNFKDVYVGLKGLPLLGTLKVGHHKEPMSIEELTSHRFQTFMERSLPNIFVPGRNSGASFFNTALSHRVSYAAGVFMDAGNFGNENGTDNNFHATMRVTALPWYSSKTELLHVGFAYSYRESTDNSLRMQQRPETHQGPRFVDTGTFGANSENVFDSEVALVLGPFSAQGEYLISDVDAHAAGVDPTFHGYYIKVSFFLTGESRGYVDKKACFDRVKPQSNFGNDGFGAIELAVRYSGLDLNDQTIRGGKMNNITAGLNWYLNPNTRIVLNYTNSHVKGVGDANIGSARFQVDF